MKGSAKETGYGQHLWVIYFTR